MNLKISPTASFDVEVAIKYGHTEALLINHFAHWIRINQRKDHNRKDGHTWMYQTLEDIAENFPYLTKEQVRTTIDHLCKGKNRRSKKEKSYEPVLIKANYNKLAIDKTCWYAFRDESFLNSNNYYERANAQSSGQMPRPIPEANKAIAINPFHKKGAINSDCKKAKPQKSPLSNRKEKEVALLMKYSYDLGFNLTEKNFGIWLSKYDIDRIKRNLLLATRRKYVSLEKFLEFSLKNDCGKEEQNIVENKEFTESFCKKHKIFAKITEKYIKLGGNREIYFKLDPPLFNQMMIDYFTKKDE